MLHQTQQTQFEQMVGQVSERTHVAKWCVFKCVLKMKGPPTSSILEDCFGYTEILRHPQMHIDTNPLSRQTTDIPRSTWTAKCEQWLVGGFLLRFLDSWHFLVLLYQHKQCPGATGVHEVLLLLRILFLTKVAQHHNHNFHHSFSIYANAPNREASRRSPNIQYHIFFNENSKKHYILSHIHMTVPNLPVVWKPYCWQNTHYWHPGTWYHWC